MTEKDFPHPAHPSHSVQISWEHKLAELYEASLPSRFHVIWFSCYQINGHEREWPKYGNYGFILSSIGILIDKETLGLPPKHLQGTVAKLSCQVNMADGL